MGAREDPAQRGPSEDERAERTPEAGPTRRELITWSLVALAGSGTAVPTRIPPQDRLAIVVAQDSPIRALTRFELRKLYLGARIHGPGGERIIPFNQPPSAPDRVAFEARVLDMTPDEIARYWIDRKIRGESGAPKAVSPVDVLQRLVSRLAYSIAYVRASQVLPQVRPIAIDGNLPGDDDYRLFL